MFARLSLALAGSTLLLAAPALAQNEPVSISVRVADLDLASAAGKAQLNRRIGKAVDEICDTRMGGVAARDLYLSCKAETLASADRDMARLALDNGRTQLARNTR